LASGCSPTPTSTPTPSAAPSGSPAPASSPAPIETTATSDLPDLALANVKTEVAAARGAMITAGGGTISATGSNGAVYTLNVPAGAISASQEVGVYPVGSVADLPQGATLLGAIQFTPDGLQLAVPATLTIQLPSAPDAAVTGVVWHGDGTGIHREPTTVSGQAVTLQIDHFSGAGAWMSPANWLAALHCDATDYECQTEQATDLLTIQARTRANLLAFLRTWYHDTVLPFLQASSSTFADDATSADVAAVAVDDFELGIVYGGWLDAINVAGGWLGDPTFTVSPQVTTSRRSVTILLIELNNGYNLVCSASGTSATLAIEAANKGVLLHHDAERYGIATHATRLDYASLLAKSCIQIVIDPARSYSGKEPGDNGSVELDVGYTRAGGPVLTDRVFQVESSIPGSNNGFTGSASAGHYSQVVPWPLGLDPLKIDITATLRVTDPVLAIGGATGTFLTELARSDRITKHAEDLFKSTFDFDFDGWSHGTIDAAGTTTYGEADHTSIGGGVIHLDGRGTTVFPKAWIFRMFSLPASTKYFSFDVSAEVIAGSSSSVAVRIVGADGSDTLLLPPTSVRNATNHLSFVHKRFDISRWAGQDVTIYIEQTYNHIGTFDKEIYIDNVRITAV
jgi:hypothetical protein